MRDNLTSALAPAGTRDLSTDPKRMTAAKAWDAIMRGARQYGEPEGFVTVHRMPASWT